MREKFYSSVTDIRQKKFLLKLSCDGVCHSGVEFRGDAAGLQGEK